MKIFDMHIHADAGNPNPDSLIQKMEKSGIYGGVIFSQRPQHTEYKERIQNIFEWTKGYDDRLFPAIWIHPYEDDAIKKVEDAIDKGICAFKMICDNYFVYEDKVLKIIELIAKANKPIFFHSGILWMGVDSSQYNRPVSWEKLISVEKLKFSLGHCSWPWYDECIATYGKFLNSYVSPENCENPVEMFLDLTPGTPKIFRKDLLFKIFNVGYDVPHNIMFGGDCCTSSYNSEWIKKWLNIDAGIFDELGVCDKIRELIYHDNIMRFLGKMPKNFVHKSPITDDGEVWSLECYE